MVDDRKNAIPAVGLRAGRFGRTEAMQKGA